MTVPISTLARRTNGLILARDLADIGGDAWLRKGVGSGTLIRLRHGVYVGADAWRAMDGDERYLTQVMAVSATHPEAVFTGFSAAALWRLPVIGHWPPETFVLSRNSGGRRRAAVVEQRFRVDPDITRRDGILLSSAARAVVDVSRSADFACALAMADAALHVDRDDAATPLCTIDELWEHFESLAPFRGSRQCKSVLEFANGLSGSAGESLSRLNMRLLGFPAPVLQHSFYDVDGFIGTVDFWWPDYNLIGEFDGKGKYTRAQLLNGETPAQAVYREKIREDRLRALGPSVSRWDWNETLAMHPLKRKLLAAGLPILH